MKTTATLLAAFLLSVFCFQVQAQDYQPFSRNLTYHFTNQDTVHSLRIASGTAAGPDSVFSFNPVQVALDSQIRNPACPGLFYITNTTTDQNLFGRQMIKRANGAYLFITASADTFVLQTKGPVGQSWTFSFQHSISATLTGRGIDTAGSVTDSVLTISLSNGRQLKLSRQYGFLQTHSFSSYGTTEPVRELQFFALPEKGLGKAVSSPLAIFDFQPGDSFGRVKSTHMLDMSLCSNEWERMRILSRYDSPGGDTIRYTVEVQTGYKGYGGPGAPPQFCSASGQSISPVATRTMVITHDLSSYPQLRLLSHGFESQDGLFNTGIFRTQYHNRMGLQTEYSTFDSCNSGFGYFVDAPYRSDIYAAGIGLVYAESGGMFSYSTTTLECYTKGTETWGTCLPLSQLVSAGEEAAASMFTASAFPNPFTAEPVLQLSWGAQATANSATVAVYNTLGQQVHAQVLSRQAPTQDITLPLSHLPAGLYVAQVRCGARMQQLKLVKAE